MNLISEDNPILHNVATYVKNMDEVRFLFEGMKTIVDKHGALGIAAPQLGFPIRLIYVKTSVYTGFIINPVIDTLGSKVVKSKREGCLSYKGLFKSVKRHTRCVVQGLDENAEWLNIEATKLDAFILQHEIDHLNGVTIG